MDEQTTKYEVVYIRVPPTAINAPRCASDLFIDTTEAAREFGVRPASLNEYVQKVPANAPTP